MALSVYQWQEPDTAGDARLYLAARAEAARQQHDMAALILRSAQQAAQQAARARDHADAQARLDRAEELRQQRLAEESTPFTSPYANDATSPPPASAAVATPYTPPDAATATLGLPTTGGEMIQAANVSQPGEQRLGMRGANPNAAPITLPKPQFADDAPTPADAVLAGRDNFSAPVDLLTAANAQGGQIPAPITEPGLPVEWMKSLESFAPKAFKDGKQLSVGYGTRATSPNETLTEMEATARLQKELADSAKEIDNAAEKTGVKLSPNQREALISYDYNTGLGASAIVKSKGNVRAIGSSILHGPITSDGRVEPGLVTRRKDEYARFMGGGATDPDALPALDPRTAAGMALPPQNDPASQVLANVQNYASQLEAQGIPKKRGQVLLAQFTKEEQARASRAALSGTATRIDPNSALGVDAAVEKARRIAEARASATVDGAPLRWEGETGFTKGGKAYRYDESGTLQPVTKADAGTLEQQASKEGWKPVGKPGYENVYTNEDGTVMQQVGKSPNGKMWSKPYASSSKIHHLGDTLVRMVMDADGNEHPVVVARVDKVPPGEQPKLTEAMKAVAEAKDKLTAAQAAQGEWFSEGKITKAKDAYAKAQTDLGVYVTKYPFLKDTVGKALDDTAADPTMDADAFKSAFAAAKSGDVLTYRGKQYKKP